MCPKMDHDLLRPTGIDRLDRRRQKLWISLTIALTLSSNRLIQAHRAQAKRETSSRLRAAWCPRIAHVRVNSWELAEPMIAGFLASSHRAVDPGRRHGGHRHQPAQDVPRLVDDQDAGARIDASEGLPLNDVHGDKAASDVLRDGRLMYVGDLGRQ